MAQIENSWIAGLGIYEPGKPIEDVARELGLDSADDIIKLASNENALGPSPKAMEAVSAAVRNMHLYPDGGGYYLRKKLAHKFNVSMKNVVLGNGSNELVDLLCMIYLHEGQNLVMAEQSFVAYLLGARKVNAEVRRVPMTAFRHDLPAMLEAIDENTRILCICNPNNPTGTIVSQEEVQDFMDAVPDHVAVIFDEAYIELMDEKDRIDVLPYVLTRPHTYLLRTFSKAYGLAGLRVGYGIGREEDIALFNRVRAPFNINSLALVAAEAAMDDQDHVEKTLRMTQDGLALFEKFFDDKGLSYVKAYGNFMIVKVGSGREVFKALQQRHIITRPMDGYGLSDYLRISIGTEPQNKRLIAAMNELMEQGVIKA
ncbi:MAG: histidinol-phosphate transaminase [Spartobacteria bacterium]|nr:histidinol-phosphate transaminase [Spartobacteria bacterium]